ncbi:carboxymuconolactone decarboxylase family protein [Chitinophaga sancti]|uniref:Carboxymuconolactone decarboxylase family protein n=1 Tax=Chitinophaga sancti TaxID=1004 RepID=A0A1K1LX31_9BACT|nr:carboxymuconolactone decarboxylase family protein [Chitinophaga sancti]WQG89607.1 carboxymuconolactone decarboxylase family protein [Chitinophaga sancti]SFW15485.1 hypothetical protein SAMN05661012_00297 [Chitinophaga sancti]
MDLTRQQESLVAISLLTATGNLEELNIALNLGLDAGLTVNEVEEVLVQLNDLPGHLNFFSSGMAVLIL